MSVRAMMLLAIVMFTACGDDEPAKPNRKTCSQLRDHYVGLRLYGDTDAGRRKALSSALGEGFVSDCIAQATQAELECAMSAKTLGEFRSCSSRR